MHQQSKQDRADFETIARQVGERGPDIRAFVVDTKQTDWADARFERGAPSLTVSPMPIKRFELPSLWTGLATRSRPPTCCAPSW